MFDDSTQFVLQNTYYCPTSPKDHKTLSLSLTDNLITRGLISSAQTLIHRLIKHSSSFSHSISEGDMEMAMGVFRRMFDMQCEPDTYVYNMLLYGCFRLSDVVMLIWVKENRFDEADDLFDKMSSSNVAPDHVLYLYLENNYPKGQEFNVLLLVSKSSCLAESWVALKFLPNEVFSVFISALSAAGKTNHALNVFNKMIIYGCEPLLSSYNSLIRTLCQEAHVKEAEFLIDRMCGQGLVPNLATYLVMINEHCEQGDMWMAFEVLEKMDERGLGPVSQSMILLLVLYAKRKDCPRENGYLGGCLRLARSLMETYTPL
ncbi:hypothetical protein IFM89_018732 [Coptis chinensis]|uniref:Pentatricopeptide repeat-containing protein n=1 Tax=Coptis chinensis TaxID=261450 RepID=A0A835M0K7_9MAGN|nr:hypothetical protein IFM89_018732 [Coptis chinensis]